MHRLINILSFFAGFVFFIFLFLYMYAEAFVIWLKERFRLTHLYSFREADFIQTTALAHTLHNSTTIKLGKMPFKIDEEVSFVLPEAMGKAKDLLLDFRLNPINTKDTLEVEAEISNDLTGKKEYIYLFFNASSDRFNNDHSTLIWYHMPANAHLHIKLTNTVGSLCHDQPGDLFATFEL